MHEVANQGLKRMKIANCPLGRHHINKAAKFGELVLRQIHTDRS